MSFKKCKVIMLPTNNKAENENNNTIYLNHYSEELILGWRNARSSNQTIQHLYITSDEEIKDNFKGFAMVTVRDNIRIHYLVEVIVTEQNQCYCKEDRKFSFEYYSVKPIIATTDKSITIPGYNSFDEDDIVNCYLPQPSKQFIEKYIEEYNKGNVINDVLVEYKNIFDTRINIVDDGSIIPDNHFKLKVNHKDNTITIKKVKDSWNREEVIELISDWTRMKSGLNINLPNNFDNWIETNL